MGLKHGDLRKLVAPEFGVDLYDPVTATAEEVAVLSFSALTKEAAADFASFVDKSVVPGLMDSKASPGPGDDGQYRIYVEILRDEGLPVGALKLLKDIINIVPETEWKFKVFADDREYDPLDEDDVRDAFLNADGSPRLPAPAKEPEPEPVADDELEGPEGTDVDDTDTDAADNNDDANNDEASDADAPDVDGTEPGPDAADSAP